MMAALMEVGSGNRPPSFISSLLREGLEAEAAQIAGVLEPAGDVHTGGLTSGETAHIVQDPENGCGGDTPLRPAPADNLVLYDCCFEGLYFHRNGIVNRLMRTAAGTDAPQQKGRGPSVSEHELPTAPPESLTCTEESARQHAGIGPGRPDSGHQCYHAPDYTEESRTFKVMLTGDRVVAASRNWVGERDFDSRISHMLPDATGRLFTRPRAWRLRLVQEEYTRCAHRMMVLKCLCEHSLPPW